MKRRLFLYAALIACTGIMYSSCGKIASLIRATAISWQAVDVSFNVPIVTDTANFTSVGSGSFTYNIDSLIKAQTLNQLGLANIDQFTLTSCTMTIQNPDASNNFANFESAGGSLSTSANTTPITMGTITTPDTYSATLNVPVTTANLKAYVSPSGTTMFTYSVQAKARRATTKVLNVTVHVEYNIHVTP